MTIDYINKKKKLIKFLKTNNIFNKSNLIKYENLIEISKNFTNTQFKKKFFWYQHVKKRNQSIIKFKKIQHLNHWIYDKDKGIIEHKSGHFFSIIGVSTKNANREVKSWDQPFIKQKNLKGGIIGLVRKKINGLPFYLIDAKFEPGNVNSIQLSPSVQSTYSNLNRIHKGKHNLVLNYYFKSRFENIKKKWVSEDGGRLYKKSNLHWIIETKKNKIKLPYNYQWLTLWEIYQFISKGNYVSPHLRSILTLL
jgi:oxidase EvaA